MGTSGFITNTFKPGACMVNLNSDWATRNHNLAQKIMMESCYMATSESELRVFLTRPPLYGKDLQGFVWGTSGVCSVIPAIEEQLHSILTNVPYNVS
jgi:hypothetical protein